MMIQEFMREGHADLRAVIGPVVRGGRASHHLLYHLCGLWSSWSSTLVFQRLLERFLPPAGEMDVSHSRYSTSTLYYCVTLMQENLRLIFSLWSENVTAVTITVTAVFNLRKWFTKTTFFSQVNIKWFLLLYDWCGHSGRNRVFTGTVRRTY